MTGLLSHDGVPEKRHPSPRTLSLRTRLVLLGTLVTLAAILSAFALLSFEIGRQSRAHLADLLVQNQQTVLELQKRSLEELLRTSRLMTESPTLRAAMETYESERPTGAAGRSDLLETIRTELDKIRRILGKDLAIITGAQGSVLAASPVPLLPGPWQKSFPSHPCVRRALEPDVGAEGSNLAVLEIGADHYQIGCVPIVLQDFVIGTLTVGERIDARSLSDLRAALRSEVIVAWGGAVLASTLSAFPPGSPAPWGAPRAGAAPDAGADHAYVAGGQEYVLAPLSLGSDASERPATLILLKSLSEVRAAAGRSLLLALLACGAFAIVLGSLAAWRVSRSVLDPLERFVAFMRSVAEGKDHSRHVEGPEENAEIEVLKQAYNLLIDSLEEQKAQLLAHAREELVRVERLRESEKLASLGRMLSGAAHEINNPLTGVVGNLDILLGSPEIEDALRQRLERIHKEAGRIAALVRNLLRVAHRDAGERDLVEINQLLKDTAAIRQHDFAAAGLKLRLEVPPEPVVAHANGLELQQVFLNIINNAYDALKETARDPCLTVRAAVEGGFIVVVFEDGGPGMKDSRKIFDPFYTTKEVGKGTGLGLSISHAIVQNHGGQITAENRPEGGARFTVRLPVRTAGAAPRPTPEPRQVTPPQAPRLSVAVLVMEDEPSVLELQQAILGSLGATCVGARTGAEAIELLERRSFDLIMCDLKLPGGVSGQDLYRWIETHRPECVPRVLFVTGDSASKSTREFLHGTGRRCLLKPFSVEEYVTAIQETLGALRPAA